MRMEAVRDIGGTLGTLDVALGALKYATKDDENVEVETDPKHTNFGKVRLGKTTYDFFGGLLPIVRTASRLATGVAKTAKGEYRLKGGGALQWAGSDYGKDLPGLPFGGRTALGEIANFGEGKLSPMISATKSGLSGTGYGGEKYGWPEFVRDTTLPMAPVDVVQAWKNWDAEEGLKNLPSLVGVGVNTELPEEEEIPSDNEEITINW